MAEERESYSIEFEREKWLVDVELRRRELDLQERDQKNRDSETELKRAEQQSSRWRSPVVVAIFAAAVAAGGNAVVALVNGTQQRDLEERRHSAEDQLEHSKSESARILEMIKTGDPEKAAGNLDFLLRAGLVTDRALSAKLDDFLKTRTPGRGPSLPAADSRIAFDQTEDLPDTLQTSLHQQFDDYFKYLDTLGFPAPKGKVRIKVQRMPSPNAYYADDSNTIFIDPRVVADTSIPLREYNHYVLMAKGKKQLWVGQYSAIESGLADYFICSFLNNPKLGEKSAKAFGLDRSYIRLLDNDRKFNELDGGVNLTYDGAEIWGGAFWQIRDKLERDLADSVIAKAWLNTTWSKSESKKAGAFVKALLMAARSEGSTEGRETEAVLRARKFPVPR
jgi:hypothetical protein